MTAKTQRSQTMRSKARSHATIAVRTKTGAYPPDKESNMTANAK